VNIAFELLKPVVFALVLAGSISCGGNASVRSNLMSVENELNRIQAGSEVPTDLHIMYDDMHGLWGGTSIVITGNGNAGRRERERGNSKSENFERSVTREQLLELVKLLIEHKAWEQRTAHRDPVPDESRASLRIQVNGQSSNVWEWFNDMEKNERLIKIKMKMKQMTS